MPAPIVLFIYNRPEHTRRTLESLAANPLAAASELFVFADGAKTAATETERKGIDAARSVVREKSWCKTVVMTESETNKGLARSVIEGVTQIVNRYGTVIVLEDDLVLSRHFLQFINDGLEMYAGMPNVYSINGYMFPIETALQHSVLLPYTSTWGWGTWKEKWQIIDLEMRQKEAIATNLYLRRRFNLADYDYTSMLGYGNNSWGIRWYYSVFKRNGLCVFPAKSLVQNNGFDGSGENCGDGNFVQSGLDQAIEIVKSEEIDLEFYNQYINYFIQKKSTPTDAFRPVLKRLKASIETYMGATRIK
ncbi:MAG: glycosyltransferase [Rhizobacter sp.]|nr:glycosyltransferase [Chlorobiales bacterium]